MKSFFVSGGAARISLLTLSLLDLSLLTQTPIGNSSNRLSTSLELRTGLAHLRTLLMLCCCWFRRKRDGLQDSIFLSVAELQISLCTYLMISNLSTVYIILRCDSALVAIQRRMSNYQKIAEQGQWVGIPAKQSIRSPPNLWGKD